MVGWMGTKQYFRVTGWSPSTFLTFALPHTLSQGLARDFHPKPAWSLPGVDLTVLHPQPPHYNSSLQTQLQPSWVRRRLFLAGDKQKIACLVPE